MLGVLFRFLPISCLPQFIHHFFMCTRRLLLLLLQLLLLHQLLFMLFSSSILITQLDPSSTFLYSEYVDCSLIRGTGKPVRMLIKGYGVDLGFI